MPPVCWQILRRIQTTGVREASISGDKILSLVHSSRSIGELKQIQAHIIRKRAGTDVFIATKLLESAVVARKVGYAIRIFYSIDSPNAYTWTTMIRGFVEFKDYEKAIDFYSRMMYLRVPPNSFTFLFMLKTYSTIGNLREGIIIHGKVFSSGFDCDKYLHNALVHLYVKCGDLRSARTLFDEIPQRNIATWNAMLHGGFLCGDIEYARELFDEMPEKNVVSWNTMLSGYTRWGYIALARSLFEEMPHRDLLSWSTMISSYAQNQQTSEAMELFHQMQLAGVNPDEVIVSSALCVCAQIGALDTGKWLHAYVERKKLRRDVVLWTSLIDMYAKCGSVDMALQVFNRMEFRNLYSWNSMICGLSMHGMGHEALELFKFMEHSGVLPNEVTFVGVLNACCHIGGVNEARLQFQRMTDIFHIDPTIEHYGCMVDALGRAGMVEEAKQVIEGMPMLPNIVVWGALLGACLIHGDIDTVEVVVKQLMELAPADAGCYVLASNVYAVGRKWNDVARIRKVIREKGVERSPGCSWVEVGGFTHEFVVHDESHPQWDEITRTLDKMFAHLEEEGYLPDTSLILCDEAEVMNEPTR